MDVCTARSCGVLYSEVTRVLNIHKPVSHLPLLTNIKDPYTRSRHVAGSGPSLLSTKFGCRFITLGFKIDMCINDTCEGGLCRSRGRVNE